MVEAFEKKGFCERFFNEYQKLSLPENNWQVWGGLNSFSKSPWNSPNQWDDNSIFKARITGMVSQLKLSNMKYWDKKPPNAEFAGLKLLTDLDFFNK